MAEWAWATREGSGVVVFRDAFPDLAAATEGFFAIIERERRWRRGEARKAEAFAALVDEHTARRLT
jgi:hypothetical protein